MKKVINGKMYNTETAEELANWGNGLGRNDFKFLDETLYRTKKGTYFLCGEGGALTQYAVSCGQNSWCGGADILPLTIEGAKSWVESHLDGDEYIEIFGEPEEA